MEEKNLHLISSSFQVCSYFTVLRFCFTLSSLKKNFHLIASREEDEEEGEKIAWPGKEVNFTTR